MFKPTVFLALGFAFLAGCSNSSSGSGDQAPPPPPADKPVDSAASFTIQGFGFQSPTVVNDNLVLVIGGRQLHLLNAKGESLASYDSGEDQMGASAIPYGDNFIVPILLGGLALIDKNGQELNRVATGGRMTSEPIVMADQTIVVSEVFGSTYFIRPDFTVAKTLPPLENRFMAPANRGTTVLLSRPGFGIDVMDSSGRVLKTIPIITNRLSAPAYVNGGVVFGTDDGKVIFVGADDRFKVTELGVNLGPNTPVIYSTGEASFTTSQTETLFIDSAGGVIGKFKVEDDPADVSAVEVSPGVAAIVGVKAVYYVDVKTAQLLEKVDIPQPPQPSIFKPFWYVPGVLSDGTLVFSVPSGEFTSKVYFLKRGQKLE